MVTAELFQNDKFVVDGLSDVTVTRLRRNGLISLYTAENMEAFKARLNSDSNEYNYTYRAAELPVGILNILAQPRITFDAQEVQNLSADIFKKQQLNPVIVARLSEQDATIYVNYINEARKNQFERLQRPPHTVDELVFVDDLTPRGLERVCYIVIDGQTRVEGISLLTAAGAWRDVDGTERNVKVTICDNIPPDRAIHLQITANFHNKVKLHEEAEAIGDYFTFKMAMDPFYTLHVLSYDLNMTLNALQERIKYYGLPSKIKELVEKGRLAYSAAYELSKIRDLPIKEQKLRDKANEILVQAREAGREMSEILALQLATNAIVENRMDMFAKDTIVSSWSAKQLRERIASFSEEEASPQLDMFGTAVTNQLGADGKKSKIGEAERKTFARVISDLRSVMNMYLEGKMSIAEIASLNPEAIRNIRLAAALIVIMKPLLEKQVGPHNGELTETLAIVNQLGNKIGLPGITQDQALIRIMEKAETTKS